MVSSRYSTKILSLPCFLDNRFFSNGRLMMRYFFVVPPIDDIASSISTGAIQRYGGSFIMPLYWSYVDVNLPPWIVSNFHQ